MLTTGKMISENLGRVNESLATLRIRHYDTREVSFRPAGDLSISLPADGRVRETDQRHSRVGRVLQERSEESLANARLKSRPRPFENHYLWLVASLRCIGADERGKRLSCHQSARPLSRVQLSRRHTPPDL